MEKIKLKVIAHAKIDAYVEGGVSYLVSSHDMSYFGHVVIGESEIEIDPASKTDLINGTVKAMRAVQKTKRAEAERECIKIEEAIQRLLCIENSPSVQS